MRSGWWWGTEHWQAYQKDYNLNGKPPEYKSSPLAADHDFSDLPADYEVRAHLSQVVDLAQRGPVDPERPHGDLWQGVRRSYHGLIHQARDRYTIEPHYDIHEYRKVHAIANGRQPRATATYDHQGEWLRKGYGLLMGARDEEGWKSFAYWVVWEGGASYMSGPSIARSVQHGVIWESLVLLRAMGVRLAELGQVDWVTDKERGIAQFKGGFGGAAAEYWIAARTDT